jgi:hypothetical protein
VRHTRGTLAEQNACVLVPFDRGTTDRPLDDLMAFLTTMTSDINDLPITARTEVTWQQSRILEVTSIPTEHATQ